MILSDRRGSDDRGGSSLSLLIDSNVYTRSRRLWTPAGACDYRARKHVRKNPATNLRVRFTRIFPAAYLPRFGAEYS